MNKNFSFISTIAFHQGGFLSCWFFVMVDFFRLAFSLNGIFPGGLESGGFLTAGFFPSCVFT